MSVPFSAATSFVLKQVYHSTVMKFTYYEYILTEMRRRKNTNNPQALPE